MAEKSRFGGIPVEDEAPTVSRFGGIPVADDSFSTPVHGMEGIGGTAPAAPRPPLPPGLMTQRPVSIPLRNASGVITPKGLDVPMGVAANAITTPLRFVAGGGEQLGRGMTRVVRPQSGEDFAGGVSDIVRGAGAMALPAAVPAIVAAPAAAALGIGAGGLATHAVEGAANAVGIPAGYSQALGDMAGVGAGGLAVTRAAPALRRAASSAIANYKGDPHTLMVQGLKPKSTNTAFEANLLRSMPELKVTEAEIGRPIAGIDDLLAATDVAKKRVWKQYTDIAGPQAQRGINLSPVADAMVATIPEKLRLENPRAAAAIEARANKYRRAFPIQQAEGFLKNTNAKLDSYYAKYPTAQRTALTGNPDTAALEAQARAFRDAIYSALDQPGEGTVPLELKQRYGSLMNIEREAYRRQNVAARQQPDSLSEQFGKWSGYGDIARGILTKNPIEVAAGATKMKMAKYLKEQQTTDALIRRAFENYKGSPAPLNIPPPFRPAGLLPPGDIITPPPADTSYVRGAPGMAQPPNARRALPSPDVITPPPADTSTVRGPAAMYPTGPNPARAVPPASTIAVPPSPLSGQGAMIPGRTGVPGPDVSGVRAISGAYPSNTYDATALARFGKPFAVLTPEQQSIVRQSRPPAVSPPGLDAPAPLQ